MRRLAVLAAASCCAAGCAAPLVVEPAPYAADVDCASIMLAVPDEVGGLAMRDTSSQATAAYGDEYPIVVRCGVEPPGPSTDPCLAVESPAGAQDWLVREDSDVWVATSFGRSPALEVTIPTARADRAVGELLGAFSPMAAQADANGLACR